MHIALALIKILLPLLEDRFSLTFIRPDVNTTLSYEYENELCISDDAEILITNAQPGAVYSLFDEEGNSLELASTALSNKVGLHLPNSLLNEGVSQFSVKINYPGCDIIDASEPISVSISKPQTPEISKAVISGCEANVVGCRLLELIPMNLISGMMSGMM